jgi:hypothetical protein
MKSRNAQTILAALRRAGEIEVHANRGPYGVNLYRLVFGGGPAQTPVEVQVPAGVQIRAGVQNFAGVQDLAGVQRLAPRDARDCVKPLQGLAPKPSLNHQEPSIQRVPASRAPAADPVGFAEFWGAWPVSQRKGNRKKCAEVWKRKRLGGLLPTILEHVKAWKRSSKWRDGFDPAPLTYLNGELWGDGPPPPSPSNPLHADNTFPETF